MQNFDEVVSARRSVRGFFRDRHVPREQIIAALELAHRAPSNCNVQPWRVVVASGAGCDRLRERLCGAFDSGDLGHADDPVDAFPGEYRRLQIECAVEMYGHMGIGRDDHAGRLRGHRRNFELFDAPHVAVVSMLNSFGLGVALDVGMFVQTFMLALQSRGVSSCAQASLRHQPTLIRSELGIADDQRILCGVSFGYEDPDVPANRTRQGRRPLDANVRFVDT